MFGGVVVRFKALLWAVFLMLAGFAAPVAASGPLYFSSEEIPAPGEGRVWIKLVSGYGLGAGGLMRAVIVDERGQMLAISPLGFNLFLACEGTGVGRDCLAYDPVHFVLYAPDPLQWRDLGRIETDGQPGSFPEHLGSAFDDEDASSGFTRRRALLGEIIRYEWRSLPLNWRSMAMAALPWWIFVLLLVRAIIGTIRNESGAFRIWLTALLVVLLLFMALLFMIFSAALVISPLQFLLAFLAAGLLIWGLPRLFGKLV